MTLLLCLLFVLACKSIISEIQVFSPYFTAKCNPKYEKLVTSLGQTVVSSYSSDSVIRDLSLDLHLKVLE